jgi:carbonic anhydrase/acetyltransferase-like protein (isoleucine patch superfamily)
MKASTLTVGDRCSVGNMAVVLYDTEMQPGSTIGPLSLLMKGETLPPGTRWLGIPTAQVPASAPPAEAAAAPAAAEARPKAKARSSSPEIQPQI